MKTKVITAILALAFSATLAFAGPAERRDRREHRRQR